MFGCPRCRHALRRIQVRQGVFWACLSCGGRAVGLGLLRKTASLEELNRLWQSARQAATPGVPCPACAQETREVAGTAEGLRLDVCRRCHFVWFDPGEHERLPRPPKPPARPELPLRARQAFGLFEAQAVAERMRAESPDPGPEEGWKFLPALAGLPVEYDGPALRAQPWLTWGLVFLITAVSLLALADLEGAVRDLGLFPSRPWRLGGLTFLTSFLLHGGLAHLIGNMYFFCVFGDNVEDWLGRGRYLALILSAALVGALAHVAFDPRPEIPVIGASGGISGIIVFYALAYPRARLGFLFRLYFYFRWVRLPAYVALILWALTQTLGAWSQLSGWTNVSALAHLGGAAVGLGFWLALRQA